MTINAYAADRGWLFADLLDRFNAAGAARSDAPLANFDSYLCIRSSEAVLSPRLEKTVVQIHCQKPQWIGSADVLSRCAGFIFTHYDQPRILREMGVDLSDKPSMCRPIGASREFKPRESMPERFTVGWVGRNSGAFKRVDLFFDAMYQLGLAGVPADALLVGSQLEDVRRDLRLARIGVTLHERDSRTPAHEVPYQELYHQMDLLCITSESEAGPLPLFEAMACGLPIVSTNCGWASEWGPKLGSPFVEPPQVQDFVNRVGYIYEHRADLFSERHWTARLISDYTLEGWVRACLNFTRSVTHG